MMAPMSGMPPVLRRPRTWAIVAVVALVVVLGGWFAIDRIQGDAPERLSFDDLPVTTTTGDAASTTVVGNAPTTVDAGAGGSPVATGLDGTWRVAGGSQAGYRVKEVLFGQDAEAVGRTGDVTGTMAISGSTVTTATVTVDMTTVASDRSQRDGQFRGRIMSTDRFPTATFALTSPIALGRLPADGQEITVRATGDLTLRGVTRTATFDLVAKRSGGQIAVNASIPVDFDDYAIPDASGGPASVGRDGEVELLLVFGR
jgi:polyisoprenoid-binding protein YceI